MSSVKIAENISRVVGVIAIAEGIFAQVDPETAGNTFGFPTSPDSSLFVPAIGARNASVGLAMLVLSYTSDRKGLGILLSCFTVAKVADVASCFRAGTASVPHFVVMVLTAGLGWVLLNA